MSRDTLLFHAGNSEKQAALMAWAQNTQGLQAIAAPDYHRLQLERWIWDRRDELGYFKMDVAQADAPRSYLGEGYFTLGLYDCDVIGDLLNIPLDSDSLDGVILTEVLEHCVEPFKAISEVRRVLKPGGLLLVTSPFVWVWHGQSDYEDYWRFTHQGWELLLKDFSDVTIEPFEWTEEGTVLFDLLRRFECFGPASTTKAASGYRGEARK